MRSPEVRKCEARAAPGLTAALDKGFRFERDTLAFANELVWRYRFDPATGALSVSRAAPPPTYSHRCFVVIRSARQFFYHARFEPGRPRIFAEAYRRLVRRVVARSPRRESPESERMVIPGYPDLRAFSREQEGLLKAECGGSWQSYCLRSHWRMVFPVWPAHQARMASRLAQRVRQGLAPIVHLFRFPRLTINHGVLLFGVEESDAAICFEAYDPNLPEHPVRLTFERASGQFTFPRLSYWGGGMVRVIEIYCGGLY